jgi:hypothetical protein
VKKLVAFSSLVASLAVAGAVEAQVISPNEAFPYTPGPLVTDATTGQGPWLLRGGATATRLEVIAGSLSYSGGGIPASSGNSVRLRNVDGDDGRFLFPVIPPADNNVYYWSGILMWDGTDPAAGSSYLGAYLLSQTSGTTLFRGILRVNSDGANVTVGAQVASSAQCPTVYAPATLTANVPVFFVIKYTEVPGIRNDTTELFLFTGAPVPATEPGTADALASYIVSPTSDLDVATSNSGSGIQAFSLRQFVASGAFPGNFVLDELRFGRTWNDVITDISTVSDWTTMH